METLNLIFRRFGFIPVERGGGIAGR